jgi:hypothetical protein
MLPVKEGCFVRVISGSSWDLQRWQEPSKTNLQQRSENLEKVGPTLLDAGNDIWVPEQ